MEIDQPLVSSAHARGGVDSFVYVGVSRIKRKGHRNPGAAIDPTSERIPIPYSSVVFGKVSPPTDSILGIVLTIRGASLRDIARISQCTMGTWRVNSPCRRQSRATPESGAFFQNAHVVILNPCATPLPLACQLKSRSAFWVRLDGPRFAQALDNGVRNAAEPMRSQ